MTGLIPYFVLLFCAVTNLYVRSNLLYYLTMLGVVLITGLRYRIGTDWWVYEKLILDTSDSNILLGIVEPLSYLLLRCIGLLRFSGYEVLCVVQSLVLFCALAALKNSPSKFLGLALYIGLFLLPSFDIIRQSLAVSVYIIIEKSNMLKGTEKIKLLISTGLHYSALVFYGVRRLSKNLLVVDKKILSVVCAIALLIFWLLGDLEWEVSSKYGVFSFFNPRLSSAFVLVFLIALLTEDKKLIALLSICIVLFGFNIDLFTRMLFWVWPLLFNLKINKLVAFSRGTIVVLIMVVFMRNNTSQEVIDLRQWNGTWIYKSENDHSKARREWEKRIIAH